MRNVHGSARLKRIPITLRYREDLVALLEAVAKRRGVDRSDIMADALDQVLEAEYPGCTTRAA